MAKFYPKRESAPDYYGIVVVLSILAILSCGLGRCHSHLVDTTDDFEKANGQNYTSNQFLQNAGNLSDKDGHLHDFDDFYNHDVDDTYDHEFHDIDKHKLAVLIGHLDEDNDGFVTVEEMKDWIRSTRDIDEYKIAVIIDYLDEDNDGFVTLEEMKDLIRSTRDRIIAKTVESQWKQYKSILEKHQIGWEKYRQLVYGVLNAASKTAENGHISSEDIEAYSEMEKMDKQRRDHADENGDGFLTKLEFGHYTHPNFQDSMDENLIGQEAVFEMEAKYRIQESDSNSDGIVTMEEIHATFDLFDWNSDFKDTIYRDPVTGHDEL